MTRDDIVKLAREAGFQEYLLRVYRADEGIERFAALIAAAEREACAKVCEYRAETGQVYSDSFAEADGCAAAIRARSNT